MDCIISSSAVAHIVSPDLHPVSATGRASTAGAAVEGTRATHVVASRPLSVWRDALATFSAHSVAVLLCAFIGFAAPTIIGTGISTSVALSAYAQTRSVTVFSGRPTVADDLDSPGIPKYVRQAQRNLVRQLQTAWLVQMVAGMLGLTFARGAITGMTLHGSQPSAQSETRGSFGEAARMTLARYPELLVGAIVYGVIIAACILGTSLLTQRLEFDLSQAKTAHIWAGPTRALSDVVRQLEWQGLNALIPNPGSPFAEFTSDLRRFVLGYWTSVTVFRIDPTAAGSSQIRLESVPGYIQLFSTHLPGGWLAACSGILIVLTESLLRFRTIMALKPVRSSSPVRFSVFSPLIASARFNLKHFGVITVHIWLLRLTLFALTVALVEFPAAMMEHFLVPNVARFGGHFEVLPILRFLAAASAALVNAILLAFSMVYDAHLYAALTSNASASTVFTTSAAHTLAASSARPA